MDPEMIRMAAETISNAGVIIFPTQSLYGIGANAFDSKAVDRIFTIKERPPEKPVLILISEVSQLPPLVGDIPQSARRIMERLWPGGVTIIFHASSRLPRNLTAGTGKIGIRLPLHPVAREVVRMAGVPVTGTSANLSGQPGASRITDIDIRVRNRVDMILAAGTLSGGIGSTVVDTTETPPEIIREGYVPAAQVLDAISGR